MEFFSKWYICNCIPSLIPFLISNGIREENNKFMKSVSDSVANQRRNQRWIIPFLIPSLISNGIRDGILISVSDSVCDLCIYSWNIRDGIATEYLSMDELSKAQHQLAFHTHDDERREEIKAFDDTKAGVKGLVDAVVTKIPRIFINPPGYGDHHDYNENKLVLSDIDGADDDKK
ncbi:hypothetical protein Syun_016357 [Stephania yunnanensis]|uniref:Uncharacterized protein n=1 Tax=Stephania yunnanensis TaxID=152371 RepID=A0AAP0J6H6_9MAGN